MNTKKTLDYLQSSPNKALSFLLEKVKKTAELDGPVRLALSQPLANYCRVSHLKQGKLVLQVESPVWASKLRFELSSLLAELRKQPRFAGLAGIDYFVDPWQGAALQQQKKEVVRPSRALSAENQHILEKTAENVEDPRLKAVLLAIAARK